MNSTSALLEKLKGLGKPQTATIYKRHGSGDSVFGALTSDIAKLGKAIGTDHGLALELWKTGNAEARVLALQIADAERLTSAWADSMAHDPQAHFYSYYLAELVARSPLAASLMKKWMKSPKEFVQEAGYGILGFRLKDDPGAVSDAEAERTLATIEREIHQAPNWARYAMNTALIAIGTYKPSLRDRAKSAAKRIGDLGIDHGDTTCKTPDAVAILSKVMQRRKRS